jgi:hypothetical protein
VGDSTETDDQAVRWMGAVMPRNEELRRFRAEAAELLQVDPTRKPLETRPASGQDG